MHSRTWPATSPDLAATWSARTAAMQINSCAIPSPAASKSSGSGASATAKRSGQQRHDRLCGRYGKGGHQDPHLHRQDQHRPARHSGLFDAVKINEKELRRIYEFDNAFFDLADQIGRGLDKVEASLADEAALPAAIRNLTSLARQAVNHVQQATDEVIHRFRQNNIQLA